MAGFGPDFEEEVGEGFLVELGGIFFLQLGDEGGVGGFGHTFHVIGER